LADIPSQQMLMDAESFATFGNFRKNCKISAILEEIVHKEFETTSPKMHGGWFGIWTIIKADGQENDLKLVGEMPNSKDNC